MDAKLTLKLDGEVIERAKQYAATQNRSLSRLIESYLKSLVMQNEPEKDEIQISPFVKSMTAGGRIPADLDYKTEYAEHLAEKHR